MTTIKHKLKKLSKEVRILTKTVQKTAKGFTLVELLVVIAIVAILAAVVVLIINPLELTRRGRDAARLSDLANLQNAINVAVQEATNSGAAILCTGTTAPCTGNSNPGTTANRNANGTGWVKVDLSNSKSVSVPVLPADPINDGTNNYSYDSDGNYWEIDTVLESQQQASKMTTDGGDSLTKFEVGSKLDLVH